MDGLWLPATGGGVALALVAVISLLLRANLADRAQYVDLQTKSGSDYEADIERLRNRIRTLETLLDTCREKRHEAEDELYKARREILRLQEQRGGVG